MDLKSRIKRSICTSQQQVFLRKEFDRFGSYRQVSRVLRELEGEGHLVRSGYGVYVKPALQAVEDFLGQVQSKLNKRSQRTVTFHSKVIQLGSQQPESSNAQSRLDVPADPFLPPLHALQCIHVQALAPQGLRVAWVN